MSFRDAACSRAHALPPPHASFHPCPAPLLSTHLRGDRFLATVAATCTCYAACPDVSLTATPDLKLGAAGGAAGENVGDAAQPKRKNKRGKRGGREHDERRAASRGVEGGGAEANSERILMASRRTEAHGGPR